MGRYRYSYKTVVRYEDLIFDHHFLLRCQPREDCGTTILEQHIDLLTSTTTNSGVDVFGNKILYGSMISPHDIFVVATNGVVECEEYRIADSAPKPIYRAFTSKTQPSAEISEFGATTPKSGSPLEQALELSQRLHSNMSYIPGVTSAESSAAESFSIKSGVCQDFAHLLISLLRDRGIKSRYVAGLVIGTGETHAWCEVYSEGVWYGVDPTHNNRVESGYIKLAHGRDAGDCSVSRGIHRGGAVFHTTEVKVVVTEIF
ncbi:MAG: transglutaminase family protein [Rikenellaceae bacterium]